MKFAESKFAHKYLDPLDKIGEGIEIGGSAHNPFTFSNKKNVDYTDDMTTIFKEEEYKICGEKLPVDIVAFADKLPLESSSQSYIINCHVFEHQYDPIKTLIEWWRVCKEGALIYSVIPYKWACEADKDRPLTTVEHMWQDFLNSVTAESHPLESGHGIYGHYHCFTPESYRELIKFVNEKLMGGRKFEIIDYMPLCDKCPNGFVFVMKVDKIHGTKLASY